MTDNVSEQLTSWSFLNITGTDQEYSAMFDPATGDGNYTIFANCSDGHTSNNIEKLIATNKLFSEEIEFELEGVILTETLLVRNKPLNTMRYEEKGDRYITVYEFDNPTLQNHKITRRITCSIPFREVPKDNYDNHLICGRIWFDTDDDGSEKMKNIDPYTYEIKTTVKDKYESKSVGIINTVYEQVVFSVCTVNWTCSGYDACNSSDLQVCNATTDLNSCGLAYTGDFSEFALQACNFCTSDWNFSLGICNAPGNNLQDVLYQYNNTCCVDTGLPTDCNIPANTTQACGYTGTYDQDDYDNIVTDALGTGGAAFVGLIPLIIITIILAGLLVYLAGTYGGRLFRK